MRQRNYAIWNEETGDILETGHCPPRSQLRKLARLRPGQRMYVSDGPMVKIRTHVFDPATGKPVRKGI